MVQYIVDMTTGLKIFWIVLGCIFLFSIYVAVTTKGKEGGSAAGVITGLWIWFAVIMQNKGLRKWIGSTKEWYLVVAMLAGFIVGMAIFAGILMASVRANQNKGFWESFAAVIFRIIGAAGCVIILLLAISQISSGGVIFY